MSQPAFTRCCCLEVLEPLRSVHPTSLQEHNPWMCLSQAKLNTGMNTAHGCMGPVCLCTHTCWAALAGCGAKPPQADLLHASTPVPVGSEIFASHKSSPICVPHNKGTPNSLCTGVHKAAVTRKIFWFFLGIRVQIFSGHMCS